MNVQDRRSLNRASQALSCLRFRRTLYEVLRETALNCDDIVEEGATYLRTEASASAVETDLIWLIRLGVLRREVDGQGLTDRVRLTPMGWQVLKSLQGEIPPADLISRLHHGIRRRWPRA